MANFKAGDRIVRDCGDSQCCGKGIIVRVDPDVHPSLSVVVIFDRWEWECGFPADALRLA